MLVAKADFILYSKTIFYNEKNRVHYPALHFCCCNRCNKRHSQSGIASAGFTNIADTTPKAHHVMVKKAAHNNTTHKTDAKTKSKSKTLKAKKPAKDSTTKK